MCRSREAEEYEVALREVTGMISPATGSQEKGGGPLETHEEEQQASNLTGLWRFESTSLRTKCKLTFSKH